MSSPGGRGKAHWDTRVGMLQPGTLRPFPPGNPCCSEILLCSTSQDLTCGLMWHRKMELCYGWAAVDPNHELFTLLTHPVRIPNPWAALESWITDIQ